MLLAIVSSGVAAFDLVQPTPDPERLLDPQRVCQALLAYRALRADLLRDPFAA